MTMARHQIGNPNTTPIAAPCAAVQINLPNHAAIPGRASIMFFSVPSKMNRTSIQ
jgi:hypothetical protein